MTKDQILADLDYASSIAKDGANTPLMGGPIGLMWGVLLTLVFTGQYLILTQKLALPPVSLLIMWISFAVIGGLGSFILGSRSAEKPGAMSTNNRVESYVWIMFAGLMVTLAIGIILNQVFGRHDFTLWDIMVPVGFAGQGLAYGVIAKMTGLKWIHMASLAGFIMSAICLSLFGDTLIYLVAAIGTILTIIVPSLYSIRQAA